MVKAARCRITGKPRMSRMQVKRLQNVLPNERYTLCPHCKMFHRVTTPQLVDKP